MLLPMNNRIAHIHSPVQTKKIPASSFLRLWSLGNSQARIAANYLAYALAKQFVDTETLFPVAYKTKFLAKKELGQDYVVMPLEGLWWAESMDTFTIGSRDDWQWKIFIVQPDFITSQLVEAAQAEVKKTKNPPALDKLCFETLHEGMCVQILHVGPYADEGPTIEKLHTFAGESDYCFDGLVQRHHEIYLSDMRRTAPEKLKTILRQPVGRSS
jgi:hypothetical protein